MTNMKIRIRDEAHAMEVQVALIQQGFLWKGDNTPICWPLHPGENIFAYSTFPTYRGARYPEHNFITKEDGEKYFERHTNTEYFVHAGELSTTPPVAASKLITVEQMVDSIVESCEGAKEVTEAPVVSPLGLRPRSVVDSLRIQEILEAMYRYTIAGKEVPMEWRIEVDNLFEEKKYVTTK